MRKAVVFLILLAGISVLGSASLRINDFASQIALDTEGTLHVTETLTVLFDTAYHGIEREIPVSYRRPTGEKLSVSFRLKSVEADNAPAQYTTRHSGGNVIIRIGDPDRYITGTHTYVISYSVGRAILFHDEYIQLYWNVTGNDWRIPIEHASAVVTLPDTVPAADASSISYVGYYGSSARGGQGVVDDSGRLIFETGYLSPGEGLTIDVSMPRDQAGIAAPTTWQKIGWFLSANKYAALPILALIGMFLLWFYKGKDPAKGTIAPRFEPPRGMHAGEVGVLIDDRADLRDITAMVIGLAVKGYLTISEVSDEDVGLADKVKRVFGRSGPTDYEFVKQKDPDTGLTKVEARLFGAIFDSGNPDSRTLSSLENKFYKVLPQLKSDLYAGLVKKGLYASNPERVRRSYSTMGMLVVFLGVAVGIWASSLYLGVAVAACGVIILAFTPIMPRRTNKGTEALRDVLGLSEYIRRAEVEQMEFHDAPEKNPQLFEKLLPYAMALNLTSIWSKQFEGLLKEPPNWYMGASPGFNPALFYIGMANLSSGMERTFVSAPRASSSGRSAWGGGGSFGGGFSGGGFGGGGGGGW
jgi:uncharacterized membrane protein YgcG